MSRLEDMYVEVKEIEQKMRQNIDHNEVAELAGERMIIFDTVPMLFNMYYNSRENGNALLDIADDMLVPMDAFINLMRENGIVKFTMSSTWTSAAKTAYALVQGGWKIKGMTLVNIDGQHNQAPAYVFEY